ncbi:thioredoxin [Aliishimia ponticola]|uniref:Thioredoxin n=1 Tax=Aliishimia ponticola TaxID=2499833 RepID=A0A4S4NBH7_9RHOB|nr:thioredoxin family protein [Aliishimia ponticola]THH35341.1 thioredoxin [Aliishimia ponticola]
MQRRTFLTASLLAAVAPALAFASDSMIQFDDSDPIQTALAEGKTVFVDYSATWCGTCARQARVIDALRSQNPDYDANIVFVNVDWDDYKSAPVTTSRNIPRRSTLLVLKGDAELGRIVAGTAEAEIKALMDTALKAATTS